LLGLLTWPTQSSTGNKKITILTSDFIDIHAEQVNMTVQCINANPYFACYRATGTVAELTFYSLVRPVELLSVNVYET